MFGLAQSLLIDSGQPHHLLEKGKSTEKRYLKDTAGYLCGAEISSRLMSNRDLRLGGGACKVWRLTPPSES